MKLFGAFACLVATVQGLATVEEFVNWSTFHGKVYEHDREREMRFNIWRANHQNIEEFNRQEGNTYTLAMNEYGDFTHTEFKIRNGYQSNKREQDPDTEIYSRHYLKTPAHKDWRKDGIVTPVKNQGQCGSCYSFSATGSLESQYMKKSGKMLTLSEQQILDCSKANYGCGGGLMDLVFKYIKKAGGVETEKSYPYKARAGSCKAEKSLEVVDDTGFVDIPSGNEDALKEALATIGPISVAIDASHWTFQFYKSGIYNEKYCSSTQLDHGVLAVGYGTDDNGNDYWIVKNSWGAGWGAHGYLRMSRNKNNQCGIATTASYPKV